MKYWDEKLYWTYQHGVHWPNDYVGPDSMTQWMMEASVGFTNVGLLRISESIRAYAYLILSSQASAMSGIVWNTVSALTAQSALLNNFENIVNCRVDIREDIKHMKFQSDATPNFQSDVTPNFQSDVTSNFQSDITQNCSNLCHANNDLPHY